MKWYSPDFTNKGLFSWVFGGKGRTERLIEYINPYVNIDINPNATVQFMDYRWDLNEQQSDFYVLKKDSFNGIENSAKKQLPTIVKFIFFQQKTIFIENFTNF